MPWFDVLGTDPMGERVHRVLADDAADAVAIVVTDRDVFADTVMDAWPVPDEIVSRWLADP